MPLSAVARLTKSNTPLSVNHQGQYPAVTITYNLASDMPLETAANAVLQAVAEMHLPDTLRTDFAGDMKVFTESAASEEILILAALIGIYIVLGVLYESLAHPAHHHLDPALGGSRRAARARRPSAPSSPSSPSSASSC